MFNVSRAHTGIYFIIFLFFCSGLSYSLALNQYFAYPQLVACVFSFRYFCRNPKVASHSLFGLLIFFSVLLFIISFIHYEFSLFVLSFGFISILPILNYLRFVLTPLSFYNGLYMFFRFQFFSLLIGFSFLPVSYLNYSGIFRNPNTFGLVSALALSIYISLQLLSFFNFNVYSVSIKSLFTIILLFLFVVISSSRAALFSSFVSITFYILFSLIFAKGIIRKSIIFSLAFFSSIFISSSNFFYQAVIYKHLFYVDSNNILNNREKIWSVALDNITLFGHGRAAAIIDEVGESIYISILHQYGILALCTFCLIILYSFLLPLIYSFKLGDYSSLSLLPMILVFPIIGFTSSIFGTSAFFLWSFCLAFLLTNKLPKTSALHLL